MFLDEVTQGYSTYNFIIVHEKDVGNRLLEFDLNNKHLKDWDREAVLDQMLNLKDEPVIYDDLDRDTFGNDWFRINASRNKEEIIEINREALFAFLQSISANFTQDERHANLTEEQKHLVTRITIQNCLEHLLNKLRYTRESGSATYSSLRSILKGYIEEHPDDECVV